MRKDILSEIVFEFFAAVYVVAAVVLLWRRPALLGILLAAGIGIQLAYWRTKADAVAVASATLLGTIGELSCVNLGIWTYHSPGLVLGIPFWIPLVWGFLFCFFRRVAKSVHAFSEEIWPGDRPLMRRAIFGALGGTILVYSVVTICLIRRIIAVGYSVLMIPTIVFWHAERDIIIFLFGAACGTLGEYICTRLGFWDYHYPFFRTVGMPLSLPLAWGVSSVLVGRIAEIWERKARELPR